MTETGIKQPVAGNNQEKPVEICVLINSIFFFLSKAEWTHSYPPDKPWLDKQFKIVDKAG